MTFSIRSRTTLGAAACALALACLAACGTPANGNGSGGSTHETGSLPKSSPSPVRKLTTTQVGRDFWYWNFKVTVVSATVGIPAAQPDYDTNPRLSLAVLMDNLGPDTHTFEPEMSVNEADQNYTAPQFNVQAVPGGETGDGTIVFTVHPGFKIADAQLLVGNGRGEQAKVPLGKTGDYVSLQPSSFPISGNITAGNMTITVTGGMLDASRDYYNQADPGHLILSVDYSATHTTDQGSASVYWGDFFLKLPDGTAIGALDGSSSPSLSAGTTKQDLVVRFDVKKPVEGAYDLVLKGTFAKDYSNVQGDLQFTISPGQSTGTEATPSIPSSSAFSPSPDATPSGH